MKTKNTKTKTKKTNKKTKTNKTSVDFPTTRKYARKREVVEEIPSEEVVVETPKENNNNKSYIGIYTEYASNKRLLIISLILNFLLVVSCFYFVINRNSLLKKENELKNEEIVEVEHYDDKLADIWNDNHIRAFIPDDYKFQLVFSSGLLNEPIVQGETNETYSKHDFVTNKKNNFGSTYIDSAVDIDNDQNILVYGSNITNPEEIENSKGFTSLHALEQEDNYGANKSIKLVYKDHIDCYRIAYVYKVEVVEIDNGDEFSEYGEPEYDVLNYTEEEFYNYLKLLEDKRFYNTNQELVYGDKLLTLVTTYDNSADKLIVVAKKMYTINN